MSSHLLRKIRDRHAQLTTLQTALEDRGNNYNSVRLIAAIAVIVSHAFYIAHPGPDVSPLSWSAYDLGAIAVNLFFVLSGVMVSRSFRYSPSVLRFLAARILRIYPALLAAGVVVAFLIGPLWSALPLDEYFSQGSVWAYPFNTLYDFAGAHIDEPALDTGAFLSNEPLWTVRYETIAYVGFAAAAAVAVLQSRLFVLSFLAVTGLALIICHRMGIDRELIGHLVRFGFAFLLGIAAYRWGDRIRLSVPIALLLVGVALLMRNLPEASVVSIIAFGYAGLTFGAMRGFGFPWLRRNDVSFGLYLYGWPIQMTLVGLADWDGPMMSVFILLTLVLTFPLALASWFLVEKPAASLKRSMDLWLNKQPIT